MFTNDGKTYKRGYNGSTWSTWDELASAASVSTVRDAVTDVEETIAPVEASTTFAAAHSIGDQFYQSDVLYEAIAPIDIGDTLTVGTNAKVADTVTEQIATVKSDLTNEVTTRATLGAHNLLALTIANLKTLNTHGSWVGNVFTHDGVAYTVDVADSGYVKSITASGTAGTYSYMYLSRTAIPLYFNKGNYILTGCPSGGSPTTYMIANSYYYNGTYVDGDRDTGNGDSASIVNDGSNFTGSISIYAAAGNVNLVFKPMIRDAKDTDPTYQPYAKTNRELTDLLTVIDYSADVTAVAEEVTYNQWSSQVPQNGEFSTSEFSIFY